MSIAQVSFYNRKTINMVFLCIVLGIIILLLIIRNNQTIYTPPRTANSYSNEFNRDQSIAVFLAITMITKIEPTEIRLMYLDKMANALKVNPDDLIFRYFDLNGRENIIEFIVPTLNNMNSSQKERFVVMLAPAIGKINANTTTDVEETAAGLCNKIGIPPNTFYRIMADTAKLTGIINS